MKPEDVGKYPLPENALIYFDLGGNGQVAGYGRIRGIAQNPVAVLGYSYIVQPLFPVPGNPYSMIQVFECWIDERKTTIGEILEDLEAIEK